MLAPSCWQNRLLHSVVNLKKKKKKNEMRLPHQEIDHGVKKNMGKGLEIFVFASVRIRKWFCLFFLYAGWASQRPKEKKKKKLGQAWRLSLMVFGNTMRASNPALKQPALYCWRSRWHSQGDSTAELPNVSMQSRVVPFATDPAKAMILPIISHSWVHTGVGADPGAAVLTCLEGADWGHHLRLTVNMLSVLFPEQRREACTVCFAKIMFPFSLSKATDSGMTGLYSTGLFFLRQWYLSSWSHWYGHKTSP